MEKITIGLASFTILLLLIFGCTQSGEQPSSPQNSPQSIASQPDNQNQAQASTPQSPSANPELSRAQICNRISGSDTKNWCLGIVNKDVSACDAIVNTENINRKNRCYGFIAVETQNPSICEKIPPTNTDAKQYCLALANRDISMCDADLGLGNDYIKEQCKQRYAKLEAEIASPSPPSGPEDASLCQSKQGTEAADDCYFFAAISGYIKPYN